jgi:hypothetical protein
MVKLLSHLGYRKFETKLLELWELIQRMREKKTFRKLKYTTVMYLPLPNLLRSKKMNFSMSKRRQY